MTLDECKNEARRRWGSLTPFRLGLVAGDTGSRIGNPYSRERARRHFYEGVKGGRQWRDKRARRAALEAMLADKERIGDITLARRIREELATL